MTGKSVPQPIASSDRTIGGGPATDTVGHRSDDGPPTQPLDLSDLFRRAADGGGDR